MIIDLILDRKEDDLHGYTDRYDPHKFYIDCIGYSNSFDGIGDKILDAMDNGTENDVRKALCNYVKDGGYNLEICKYINNRNWIEDCGTSFDISMDVISFIGRFSTDGWGTRSEVLDCFLFGNCYWFAHILSERFMLYDPVIMIDYVANHFACKIQDRVYDISGDVTNTYVWSPWVECEDKELRERIIDDCIMF